LQKQDEHEDHPLNASTRASQPRGYVSNGSSPSLPLVHPLPVGNGSSSGPPPLAAIQMLNQTMMNGMPPPPLGMPPIPPFALQQIIAQMQHSGGGNGNDNGLQPVMRPAPFPGLMHPGMGGMPPSMRPDIPRGMIPGLPPGMPGMPLGMIAPGMIGMPPPPPGFLMQLQQHMTRSNGNNNGGNNSTVGHLDPNNDPNTICRFFNSPQGCRDGAACPFRHVHNRNATGVKSNKNKGCY
jgi:hypothetical protein